MSVTYLANSVAATQISPKKKSHNSNELELSGPGVCVIKDIDRKVPDPGYVDVQIEDEEVSERWKQ